jgi:mono/diheme cytochrome c family protein
MTVIFPPIISLGLVLGLALVVLGSAAVAYPRSFRRWRVGRLAVDFRLAIAFVGLVLVGSAFFANTPETQLPNPVPATVDSIAAGYDVYLNSCARCHGVDARGGGPDSSTTQVRPPALTGPGSHLGQHTDGDLHYFVSNGLAGGMPAWAAQLSDQDIWNVINYLRSLQGT